MDLTTPLKNLSGVGELSAKKLAYLELLTVGDLINHYPFRYDDFSKTQNISQTKIGEVVTFKGEIWSIKNIYTKYGKVLTQAVFNDGSGTLEIVWFNQPWLVKNIRPGDYLQVSGKINRKGSKTTLVSPKWEKTNLASHLTSGNSVHTGRLVPVYPETYGISSKWLRAKIARLLPMVLPKIIDALPEKIRGEMLPLDQALQQIHFPESFQQSQAARLRLSFDELFFIQLDTLQKKKLWQQKKNLDPLKIQEGQLKKFTDLLPFTLTEAQQKVIEEIIADLQKPHPMNRLVQGEVGSGKTVVAAAIIYLMKLHQFHSVVMAPTEILAFQHYQTLAKFLAPLDIKIGLYTGSRKLVDETEVIVGTHALLSEKLNLEKVGLVVIDEQQRFGVKQRTLLRQKTQMPHFLTMTATPIPRTVALTLYGDLDLSIINQLPQGRKQVSTHFVPQKKRADAYQFISQKISAREQVYIITPLIEESETIQSAKAAKVEYERLKKEVFPDYKLGILHGKLKSLEKETVINQFKKGEIDILVSTSVVEVGMDIANATIMLIEGAERFGLAQLHQLRGRVGRGEKQSYCLLFSEMEVPPIVKRLKNLEKIYDGLKLAELDLQIRGAGEVFGTAQSGIQNLKIASFADLKLLEKTRKAAQEILTRSPQLDKYPQLKAQLNSLSEVILPD